MKRCLGIDTSNYTTSAALSEDGRIVTNVRCLLEVPAGERGMRQSEALFRHTVNLPAVFDEIGPQDLRAVGVSRRPRDLPDSYMPCFLAGTAAASAVAGIAGVPLYGFSHQAGHLAAALYDCGKEELHQGRYLAFHVSGGTTELVLSEAGKITLLGGTKDISAGQAIDRVGVTLGLPFPCGPALEQMSEDPETVSPGRIAVSGFTCHFSGLENQAAARKAAGEEPARIAAYVIRTVSAVLEKLTENALAAFPGLPIVYAGGVMSNRAIRRRLETRFGGFFAGSAFSSDNAAGIARLTELVCEGIVPPPPAWERSRYAE